MSWSLIRVVVAPSLVFFPFYFHSYFFASFSSSCYFLFLVSLLVSSASFRTPFYSQRFSFASIGQYEYFYTSFIFTLMLLLARRLGVAMNSHWDNNIDWAALVFIVWRRNLSWPTLCYDNNAWRDRDYVRFRDTGNKGNRVFCWADKT